MADVGGLVYGFSEGSGEEKGLLGGKGAGLATMSRMGLQEQGMVLACYAARAVMATTRRCSR